MVLGDLNDEVEATTTQILNGQTGSEIGTGGFMTRCALIPGPSLGPHFPRAVGKYSSKSSGTATTQWTISSRAASLSMGDYMQTGYPEWLANTEIRWFPKDLIKKYVGGVEHSMASDDSLYLPAEKAEEIAVALRALGHNVEPCPVDLI